MSSPYDYCMEVVRKRDHEHYLCTLLLPAVLRAHVFALRALNVETASVRDRVSEKEIGEGKLRFWHDVIKSAYGRDNRVPLEHPLALALTLTIRECQLSQSWLLRLVDARVRELTAGAYPDLSSLEEYSEDTYGAVLFLTLQAAGIRSVEADHAASHIAKAAGIATCLRAVVPLARRSQRVSLPLSVLSEHGVSQQDVLRRTNPSGLSGVADYMGGIAKLHLDKAVSIASEHTHTYPLLKRIFLCSVIHDRFLNRLERCRFNLFDNRLQSRDGFLVFKLIMKLLKRKL